MVTETIVAKKRVLYRGKCYRLRYRLITENPNRHGIEILCQWDGETERETVFLDRSRAEVYEIIRLFAEEQVFPIALKETLDSYLS